MIEPSEIVNNLPRVKAIHRDQALCNEDEALHVTCMDGTRRTLLNEVEEWANDPVTYNMYMLLGQAGTGKSTVARTVAARADRIGLLGGSFFFSGEETDSRTAQKLFTTLAFQLCVYDKDFAQAIGQALLTQRGKDAIAEDPQDQLDVLIIAPLLDLVKSRTRPVLIVVDALDECDVQDQPIVLTALHKLVQALPFFKVFLTSSPQPDLRPLIEGRHAYRGIHCQSIEEKVDEDDIKLYLKQCLSQEQVMVRIPNLRQPWNADDQDVEIIAQASGELFVTASTAILFILDTTVGNPMSQMATIRSLFSQNSNPLSELYAMIVRRAVPKDGNYDIVIRYQAIVGAILHLRDPLPVNALANLIDTTPDDIHMVLSRLRPVVSLGKDDIPHLYHNTFTQYIANPDLCGTHDLHIVPSDHHTRISTHCLQTMNRHLKYNIMNLGDLARFLDNDAGLALEGISESQRQEKIPLELRYACAHWADHIQRASIEDEHLVRELETFANQHLLHWIEAMSWIGKLSLARHTAWIIQKLAPEDLRALFSDTRRFISKFFSTIRRSALHTYYSALPFAPTESSLYQKYNKEMSHNLCQLESGPVKWDSPISIQRHGHTWTYNMDFSLDSSRFASWTPGDVKVWDAVSGIALRTFKGDRTAFSRNFALVALSNENIVTLCNVATNVPVGSFVHTTKVVNVVLSFDGGRLAAASSDGVITLWKTDTGELTDTFDDYAPNWGPLSFSPTGNQFAYISTEGGIKLWDAVNGETVASLRYGSAQHIGLLFFQNGSRLASLTWDKKLTSLTLWNPKNWSFIGYARNVGNKLGVVPNSSLLATVGGRNIQLWKEDDDSDCLKLVGTIEIGLSGALSRSLVCSASALGVVYNDALVLYDLETHAKMATLMLDVPAAAVVFSPDGNRLAAVSQQGKVYLWDYSSIPMQNAPFENQSITVTSLAFSPDCSRLAKALVKTIELWDISLTGEATRIATHTKHTLMVSALAFSQNGDRLASASIDKTIRLWNGRDGSPIASAGHTFFHQISSLSFSEHLLAAAANDRILLWDLNPLSLVDTIDTPSMSVLISRDSALLASSNFSTHLTLWDVANRTQLATFGGAFNPKLFSPDGSQLAFELRDGRVLLSDVVNKEIVQAVGDEDLSWLHTPRWNGIPISLGYDDTHGLCLFGRVPEHEERVPLLYIPQTYTGPLPDRNCFAVGSSIFGLGYNDGRVELIRSPM